MYEVVIFRYASAMKRTNTSQLPEATADTDLRNDLSSVQASPPDMPGAQDMGSAQNAGAPSSEARTRALAFKDQAKQQFDAWAATYDRSLLGHFLFRPCYIALMEEIAAWRQSRLSPEVTAPMRVLDIGCGTGTFCSLVARSPWPVEVIGLDYSPAMCAAAKKKADALGLSDRLKFVAGDSEHLPFADGAFDVVLCANSFHHYPHQGEVVKGIRRILRPGGRFLLADGFRDNAVGWVVFDVIIAAIEKEVHHAPWTLVREYFRDAGFCDIVHRKINVLFPVLLTRGDA